MKHTTLVLLFVLSILLAAPAHAASIGIYAGGVPWFETWSSCIIPTIDLVFTDLEQPLKAIELSVEVSQELQGRLECVTTPGVTITQNGDQYTIRLDNCWSARSDYSVPLFSLLYEPETVQSICLAPASSSPVDPPAISYESCDGEVVPLEVAPIPYGLEEIGDGCLLVAARHVPTAESTWGTLKTWY
jgi:hypothetical protein